MTKLYNLLILFFISFQLNAQNVAINNDGSTADPQALLDIKSFTKGILIPRTSTTSRLAFIRPPKGLMVYDTTTSSFWYHTGSQWQEILNGTKNFWAINDNNNNSINNTNTRYVGVGMSGLPITERFQVDSNIKVGTQIWYVPADDRIMKFGDGDYVTIGEAGADDRMTLTAKNFIFSPSQGAYPGNIGINTTSPISPLSFANLLGDKINLWNTDATHQYGMGVQAGLLQIYSTDNTAAIAFGNGNSASFNETVRFTGLGRVGVGTSTPTAMMEIKPSSGAADLYLNAQVTGGTDALLKLNKNASGSAGAIRFQNQATTTWDLGTLQDDHFKLKYTPTNLSILDVDNATRHIGIFTNDYTEAVNITGNVQAYGAFISRYTNAGFQFMDRTLSSYGGWNWYADNGNANLYRYTSGGNLLTIDPSGNVGIVQSAPTAPLTFNNSVGNKIDFYYGSPTSRYGIGLQGSLLQIYAGASNNDIAFGYGSSTSFTELARISNSVGVQTRGPNAGFWFLDRTVNTYSGWNWYATGGTASLFAYGYGNVMSVNNAGNAAFGTTPSTDRVSIDGGSGNALNIAGGIKVSGSNKAAFVLTADANNMSGLGYSDIHGVRIDNALCNNDPNAMIFITQVWRQAPVSLGIGAGTTTIEYGAPVYPYYNTSDGYWYVFHYFGGVAGYRDGGFTPNETYIQPTVGSKYNILIVKQ